jgi:hypothetical protein
LAVYMGRAYRVQVASRTHAERVYQVFVFGDDLDHAICNCPAGRNAKACWHLDSAVDEVEGVLDMIQEGAPKPVLTLTLEKYQRTTLVGPVRAELFNA